MQAGEGAFVVARGATYGAGACFADDTKMDAGCACVCVRVCMRAYACQGRIRNSLDIKPHTLHIIFSYIQAIVIIFLNLFSFSGRPLEDLYNAIHIV